MFTYDLIKIKYIDEGYLPNYPYRMITDKEMIDAFIREDGYFSDNYPCLDENLRDSYNKLIDAINYHLNEYLTNGTAIPSWVVSYMMGFTISVNSDEREIDNLYTLLNLSHTGSQAEFGSKLFNECYTVSKEWVKKLPSKYSNRPATMFGEPHVVKSLRLEDVNVLD